MTESTIERMRARIKGIDTSSSSCSPTRRKLGLYSRENAPLRAKFVLFYVHGTACTHIINFSPTPAGHPTWPTTSKSSQLFSEKESANEIEKVFRVIKFSNPQPPTAASSRTHTRSPDGEFFSACRGKKTTHGRKNAAEKCACVFFSLRPESF